MAQDYTGYLAVNVLNEQQVITYRLLSRALKVHVNLAKQMLYDFHAKQNAKKPSSVHATYLLSGTTKPAPQPNSTQSQADQDGEDTIMQSSPFLPSASFSQQPQPELEPAPEPIRTRAILLAKEEDLEKAKETFETISSIHIYSLEANTLTDIQVLTDCNRRIASEYVTEDPLVARKQYGTIQNPNVKRRERGKNAPLPPPVAKPADAKIKPAPPPAKVDSKPTSAKATPEPEKKPTTKPAASKRQNSDIFKSFAKSTTKAKAGSASSKEATPAPQQEDERMGGFSDDGGDDDDVDELPQPTKAPTGKSKKERKEELQAMMDQEDEEMVDADTPAAEAEDEAAAALPQKKEDDEPKETVTVENGRRRGRRRVMKKKTVKDAEGYLVTKEEAVWESFSEDEPPPKKAKLPSVAPANKTAPAKKGGKPGQGNIMSFFAKK